jgi:ComF family protein
MIGHWLRLLVPPERCPVCTGNSLRGLCQGCGEELLRVPAPCPGCALPKPVARCPADPAGWQLDGIVAPLRYAKPAADYLLALKFGDARRLGRALGLLLADAVAAAGAQQNIDTVVAVPLHRQRLIERGYNQAFEIARAVAGALRLPVTGAGLARRYATRPQTGLRGAGRLDNMTGAFTCRAAQAGRRLALVDDVITTGATVNAAAAALRAAGADSVVAWAVARTLPGDRDRPDGGRR